MYINVSALLRYLLSYYFGPLASLAGFSLVDSVIRGILLERASDIIIRREIKVVLRIIRVYRAVQEVGEPRV